MARVQIDFREDFKLQLTIYADNPNFNPDEEPSELNPAYIVVNPLEVSFIINLFSLDDNDVKIKKSIYQATWDLTTKVNWILSDDEMSIVILFDNATLRALDKGMFSLGQLQGTIWWDYPDAEMADDVFNCGNPFDTNIEIVNIDAQKTYDTIE